jgi:hypothetical protein
MAVSNEQVFIEFQADLSQLESAIDTLTRLGLVDKKIGEEFKATNALLNNTAKGLKDVATAGIPVKNSLEGIATMSKKVGANFRTDFLGNLIGGLKQGGVNIEEFNAKLEGLRGNTAFEKLQDDLVSTAVRISETAAELDRLQSSGGSVEGLEKLEAQLKADEEALASFSEQFKDALDLDIPPVPPIDPDPNDNLPELKDKSVSLRQELKNLTQQIAEAKVNGTAFGEEYQKLAERAGQLKDALADANAEVQRTGSDTRNVEGLLDLAGGVAGGFAVAQGTMAIFGDESEELQKTLLKVNAVMAVLQGLQQIQNALQKESAASQLLNRIATIGNAAAQRLFGTALAGSNAALKAFKIALAATGIGAALLVIGLLVEYWDDLKEAIGGVSEEQKKLARDAGLNADDALEQLEAMEGQEEVLKRQGKTEAEILQSKVKQVDQIIAYREQQLIAQAEMLRSQVDAERRNKEILAGILNFISFPITLITGMVNKIAEFLGSDFRVPDIGEELSGLIFDPDKVGEEGEKTLQETQKKIDELKNQRAGFENSLTEIAKAAAEQRLKDAVSRLETQLLAVKAGTEQELALRKKLIIAQGELEKNGEKSAAKRALIEKQVLKDIQQAEADFNKARIDERVAAIENQLVLVEEGSRQELDLRLKLLEEQKQAELTNIELTAAERKNIEDKAFADSQKLRREFNKAQTAEALNEEIARNEAALQGQRLNLEDRQNLEIANIEARAELEVQAANGNAAIIKDIYAKRDAEIRDFKKRMLDEQVEYEISLAGATEGAQRRALQRTVDNERNSFRSRVSALQELRDIQVDEIDQRIAAEQQKELDGLLKTEDDYKQHNLRLAQLDDERKAKIEENAQQETEIRKAEIQKWTDFAFQTLNEVVNIASSLNDIQAQKENDRLQSMKDALDSAKASGSITEKEAIARAKRIDFEERRIKQKQAEREKQVALFQAIINGAAQVIKVAANPILAAIVGALVAVQIGIIAARPLPKFAKGKRRQQTQEVRGGRYAEVSERGQEIIERDGQMFLAPKHTITWIGEKDIVYNAADTRKILDKAGHRVDAKIMNNFQADAGFKFDYRRMERIFKKHSKGVSINIQKDFIEESVAAGFTKNRYLNNRYNFR